MRKLLIALMTLLSVSPIHAAQELCERPDILKRAVNTVVCTGLVNCKNMGIKDLDQIQNSTPEQIVQLWQTTESYRQVSSSEDTFRKINWPAGINFSQTMTATIKKGLSALPTFVTSSTAITVDYNSVSKAYTCMAQLTVDSKSQKDVLLMVNVGLITGDPQMQMLMENVKSDSDVQTIAKMIMMQAHTNTYTAIRTAPNQFKFVVQPKDSQSWFNNDYVVTLKQ